MRRVAILGAGELGGSIARTLAGRGRIDEIRLIDDDAGVAAGKALDIRQAGPIEGFGTRLTSAGDLSSAAGASAIVLADPVAASPREWQGDAGLALLVRIARLGVAEDTVIVCAGAAQRELVQRGLDELGLPRARLIGSAPEALASALRTLVALEAGASPANVALAVLGRPPDRLVVPWSEATIGGHSIAAVLGPPQLQRLQRRVAAVWPPGPYALASAATRVCEAVTLGSRRLFSCFAAEERETGPRRSVCAWSVALGTGGVERIVTPSLSVYERSLVDNALESSQAV